MKKHASSFSASNPSSAIRHPPFEIILLAVTGMSPAVLTETVWALAQEKPALIPHRVIVVTTSQGRLQIEKQLFTTMDKLGGKCAWDALRESLLQKGRSLKGCLRFGTTPDDIRIITDADPHSGRSRELADIRTPSDNEAAANFLLETVRAIVENPDTRLVVSIAGGRKTMGALLYACLTLVGRETDRLTHVLVNEPFESLSGFYFPGQAGGPIVDRAGQPHDPAQARIELADVLFVPLRNMFRRELGRPAGTFSRLVERCREQVREAGATNIHLEVFREKSECAINQRRIKFSPHQQLIMLFLAERANAGDPPLSKYELVLDPLREFAEGQYAKRRPDDWTDWRCDCRLSVQFTEQRLRKVLDEIRAKLRDAGMEAVLLIPRFPVKGRFSLDLPPSSVSVQ